jgi:nitrite reductase (NO-forming)
LASTSTPGGDRPVAATRPSRRARRHLLVAGFVLAYLAAGGVVVALGERVATQGWLALHLVLLGAATNAIVVWSEHFAAALLRSPPASERVATVRALALNVGIVAVLAGVHTGRTGLAAYAAGLAVALVPFVRTAVRRPPTTAAAWMLGAGMAWLVVATRRA